MQEETPLRGDWTICLDGEGWCVRDTSGNIVIISPAHVVILRLDDEGNLVVYAPYMSDDEGGYRIQQGAFSVTTSDSPESAEEPCPFPPEISIERLDEFRESVVRGADVSLSLLLEGAEAGDLSVEIANV